MSGFYQHFHRVVVDPGLALFVMLGYWGFVVADFSRKDLGDEKTVKPSASIFFMLFGLLLIMSIGLTTYGMRLWKSGSPRLGLVSACLAFIFFVWGGSLFFRMGDGIKNLHYFTRDLQTMKAISPGFIGYCLGETTMAMIPYDTGFVPKNITTFEELDRYIVATPRGKLLMFERIFSNLPDEVRSRLRCFDAGILGSTVHTGFMHGASLALSENKCCLF